MNNQTMLALGDPQSTPTTTTDRGYHAPLEKRSGLDTNPTVTFNNQEKARVRRVIANYTPKMSREMWRQVGDFTRTAVTDFRPYNGPEADLTMSAVARLAAWSVEAAALDLDRESVFNGYNIEQYIADATHQLSKYAVANHRRTLMRIAEALGVVERTRVASRPMRRPSPMQPYTSSELASFRAMAANRSNPLRRNNWTAFITLAAGCGLSAWELLHVRDADIDVITEGVAVTTNGREVVCTKEFEDDLRHLVATAGDGGYLWRLDTDCRPNTCKAGTYVAYQMQRYARQQKRPVAGRLRATWIVDHLNNGVHLTTLTNALGITTLRPLEGYLPYLTPQTADFARASLRAEVSA